MIAVILKVKDEEEERKAKRGSRGWRERVARQKGMGKRIAG